MRPVRRVVTGHDAAGRAEVIDDSVLDGRSNPKGDVEVARLWSTATAPADNDDASGGRDRPAGSLTRESSALRIVELAPGASTPMHRTNSLDYGVVLSGAVELILDDDAVTRVEAGDVVIKRGTMHGWRNPSAEGSARIAFVWLDAKPATVAGAALPEILPGAAGAAPATGAPATTSRRARPDHPQQDRQADMSLDTVRCIVTGHDAQGRAVVTDDTRLETRMNPSKASAAAVVWTTAGSPVDLDAAEHGRDRAAALTLPGGSVLRVIDMMPGGCSPMHRTSSLDYGIVLSGEVELILDEGAIVTVGAGEVVIQRGTIHAWRNSTDTVARIAFILLDATPATVNGAPLPEVHISAGVKPDFR